jgi:hypothetical protein
VGPSQRLSRTRDSLPQREISRRSFWEHDGIAHSWSGGYSERVPDYATSSSIGRPEFDTSTLAPEHGLEALEVQKRFQLAMDSSRLWPPVPMWRPMVYAPALLARRLTRQPILGATSDMEVHIRMQSHAQGGGVRANAGGRGR